MHELDLRDPPGAYSVRARWLFPGDRPPLRDGVLTVRDGQVQALNAKEATLPIYDLQDAAILPGLVNAHTHLEFSDLTSPLGEPGERMPAWIRRVIQYRRERNADTAPAMAAGLAEAIAGGATSLGEIATGAWKLSHDAPAIQVTAFQESIGLAPERSPNCLATAREFLDTDHGPSVTPALSPHAPFTVHPALCSALVELAMERHAPIAMHLAESPEELELLLDGRGPLVELFQELGFWREDAIPFGTRPLHYLQLLRRAPRALVIHGNYLNHEELNFLAQHSGRMSLVYCPRTHAYFGHRAYHDLSELLRRGVRVCLGTDSRASNPDLSIWSELQFVARRNRVLSGDELLRLVTIDGARALHGDTTPGRLAIGSPADFCIVRLPAQHADDPHDLLWDENAIMLATIAGGKLLRGHPGFANFAT